MHDDIRISAGVTRFPADHLPAPISPIVGRETQLELATSILVDQRARLLTLAGPGGIGKTRLGLALSHRLANWLPRGVTIVELESIRDPSLVAAAIGRAVGILDKSGDSETDLIRWLGDDERLILLDNFEQLIEATPFLQRLLEQSPGVRMIVTSRTAPLDLDGERIIEVGPLEFPAEAEPSRDIEISRYPAIQYFLQHAPTVDWNVSWRSVIRISQRLDGIPLALELAGARVGLLSIDEIAEQTTGWMAILTRGRRNAPERHRTMEQTIAWSYQLLDPSLQAVFRSLCVFSGGFGREAAIEVTAATQGQLTALIDCRLLSVSTSLKSSPRFRLLEPVRDFAIEEARRMGEFDDLRSRLADWAVRLVRSVNRAPFDPHIFTDEGAFHGHLMSLEQANLLQALQWMIDDQDVERAQTIASVLADYWYLTMQPSEGLKWLLATMNLPHSHEQEYSQMFVKICVATSLLAMIIGDSESARDLAERGLAIASRLHDVTGIAESHALLGYIFLNTGEIEKSVDYSTRALIVFRQPEYEDRPWQVDILENLSLAAIQLGEIDHAAELVQEAVELGRLTSAAIGYANAQRSLGDVRCHQGRFVDAIDAHSEAFAAGVRQYGRTSRQTWHNVAQGMAGAATVAWFALADQPELAVSIVEKTVHICQRIGIANPENRLDYQRIRDQMMVAGLIQDPAPIDMGSGPDLDTALAELRRISFDLRSRLTPASQMPMATIAPRWDRGFLDRSEELQRTISAVQLATVRAIVEGRSVKEIAATDGVRQSSIYNRIDVVKAKWGLPETSSLLEVAVFAVRYGVA